MARERVIYYSDPQLDDFARTNIDPIRVGADFPFTRKSLLWNMAAWLLYYLIGVPVVFLISKLYLGLKFENRGVLRQLRDTGGFLYCNHTRMLDGFLPAMASFPKKGYVIAGADAVSLPGLMNVVLMLGVIPIPTEFSGMRRFLETISLRCHQKQCITIFPEAHIWPFYTGIRDFPDTSFRYPVLHQVPVVAMVTTYRKRRGLFCLCRKPGMTVTLSEPFFPDPSLSPAKARKKLRDQVYDFMKTGSERKENIAYIQYVQKHEYGRFLEAESLAGQNMEAKK